MPHIFTGIMKRKSIPTNTAYSFVDKGVSAITGVLLIPFIIHHLGVNIYSIWVIFLSVLDYLMLAQFGISTSFRKFIAEYHARREIRNLNEFISTAFYLLLLLSFIVVIIAFVFSPPVLSFLLKSNYSSHVNMLFMFIVLTSCVALVDQIFLSIPQGCQRFDITSVMSIASRLLYVGLVVALLANKFKIEALIIATFVGNLVVLVLHIWISIRIIPTLSISPRFFKWEKVAVMYGFGIKIQISFFSNWVALNFDKLILAKMLDARYVVIYDIGSKIILFLRDLPMMFFSIVFSRASELNSNNDLKALIHLYENGTKYCAALFFGIIAFFYPQAHSILFLWIGPAVDPQSAYVFRILLVGTMFILLTGVGSSIAKGMGKPERETLSNAIMAICNIVLSYTLCKLFGFRGIVIGTATAYAVGATILVILINKLLRIGTVRFCRQVLTIPVLLNFGLLLFGIYAFHLFDTVFSSWDIRLRYISFAVCYGIFLSGTSILVYTKLKFIPILVYLQKPLVIFSGN